MQKYSLKFNKLSKYSLSLVSNPTDDMSLFVIGVSNDLVEERRSAVLHDNMYISRLMVHAQKNDETTLIRKNRDCMRARSYVGGAFKGSLEIQESSRRCSITKFLLYFLRLERIGCLT